MLEEIDGYTYKNTKGFYEKWKSWSYTAEQICQDANPLTGDDLWTEYSNPPSQRNVWEGIRLSQSGPSWPYTDTCHRRSRQLV